MFDMVNRDTTAPWRGRRVAAIVAGFALALAAIGTGAVTTRALGQARTGSQAGQAPSLAVTFVKWTDPKEGAFSLDVPKGWTVDGGLVRVGPTDVRRSVQVRAPGRDMTVILGDAGLPLFSVPTALDQRMGRQEGYTDMVQGDFQRMVLHYMPAPEFNRWYLQNAVAKVVDNLNITGEQPLEAISQKLTGMANQGNTSSVKAGFPGGKHTSVSVGMTKFTGRVKESGKTVCGLILSTIRYNVFDNNGVNSWYAEPMIIACQDDANIASRIKTLQAVYLRMSQSLKPNAAWDAKESERVAKIHIAAMKKMRDSAPRGGNGSGRGTATRPTDAAVRQSSMASYWKRNAARAESQHQFINYLRDEKDIIDPTTGQRTTVSDH